MFKLSPNKILFHRDITNKKDETCPGEFIDSKAILISMVRRFVLK
jgi:hypothetical protein